MRSVKPNYLCVTNPPLPLPLRVRTCSVLRSLVVVDALACTRRSSVIRHYVGRTNRPLLSFGVILRDFRPVDDARNYHRNDYHPPEKLESGHRFTHYLYLTRHVRYY